MTYEEMENRRAELKADHPNGRMSNHEIDVMVRKEDIVDRIANLPDTYEDIRSILADMMEVL